MTTVVQSIYAHIGPCLLAGHLLGWVLLRRDSCHWRRWSIVVLSLFIAVVPVGAHSLTGHVRSVVGDLSTVTLLLLGSALWRRLGGRVLVGRASARTLRIAVVTGGAMLYPMTLGLSMMDPYRLGYVRGIAPLVVLLVAVAVWLFGRRSAGVVLVLAILAFHGRVMESTNLWDYCLDPLLFVYASASFAIGLVSRKDASPIC